MAPKAKAEEGKPETDPKKRLAPEAKELPAKQAKKDEPKDEKQGELETEKDAPADNRPKLKESIIWDPMDCTLNALPTVGGKVLMSLSDGGMQYLISGARANVGIKSGRYMYEVKVVEALNPAEAVGSRGKAPLPRQILRVGFSLAGTCLVLGETEDGICFDAEGTYTAGTSKTSVCQRIGRDQTIAVLLNLDEKSANFQTISLFRNGERFCEPQPLPEALKGKVLYPHVSYRSVSVQVNFGPCPLVPLSFKCRCLSSATNSEVIVAKSSAPPDGKYSVIFPVAFPDEGTFDWLDTFLEKNPHYVELSDRKIIDWATQSGLSKPKSTSWKNSMDKPEFSYGLPAMDDLSVRRVLQIVAPLVPRNYVVMEVKENLVEADRKANLQRFSNPVYKKIANVVMGEPNAEHKKLVHSRILKEKRDKAEVEWKAKRQEKDRKKQLEARQKQLSDMRKKAEEQRKTAEDEKKTKVADTPIKKDEGTEGEGKQGDDETKVQADGGTKEESKEEVKSEEKGDIKKEQVKEEEEKKEDEDDDDDVPPEVELTEEEKKVWFRPPAVSDLTSTVLNQAFAKFVLPEKSEGFDEVKYEWQSAKKASEYLRVWVLERKITSRMEDLKPSDWFKTKYEHFTKSIKDWQDKQKVFVEKMEVDKKEDDATDVKVGDDLDIFAIEDVCDVGKGEPLFGHFAFEDWALLTLRYELFLLVHAYKHDADDEERIGVHESNLVFYHNKYYHKQLTPKFYGKDTNKELVDFVKDTVTFDKEHNVLKTELEPDTDALDIFVKLTEESRRERQRRVDAGDETARLKFNPLLGQVSKPTVTSTQAAKPASAVRPGAQPTGAWGAAPRPGAGFWGPRPGRAAWGAW